MVMVYLGYQNLNGRKTSATMMPTKYLIMRKIEPVTTYEEDVGGQKSMHVWLPHSLIAVEVFSAFVART